MSERSQSNPLIDLIDWDALRAFNNLKRVGLVSGGTAVSGAVEVDAECVDVVELHDFDPTTRLFT